MPDGSALGLRERKKLDTRRALSDAALALAFEHGVEKITREGIAAAADVSVRTFSNYFTSKYEALAYRQIERLRHSLEALRGRPANEPLWVAIIAAVLEPLEAEEASEFLPNPAQLTEIRKLMLAPQMRAAVSNDAFADWVDVIAERTGTDPRDMYPRLVVGVIAAVAEAAIDTFVDADPPLYISTLLRRGFATVVTGLPAPPTQRGEGDA